MQPLTMIVIDDEADQVDLTVMLLESRGHQAIGTTDGSRAVELVSSKEASVVVLDMRKPPTSDAFSGRWSPRFIDEPRVHA